MRDSIITDEWLDVKSHRLPIGRDMIVRTATGLYFVARWNGCYWVDSNTGLRNTDGGMNQKHVIKCFYVFGKYNENDID